VYFCCRNVSVIGVPGAQRPSFSLFPSFGGKKKKKTQTNKTQLPKELFFDLRFFAFAHGLEAAAGCIYNFINHGNSLNII